MEVALRLRPPKEKAFAESLRLSDFPYIFLRSLVVILLLPCVPKYVSVAVLRSPEMVQEELLLLLRLAKNIQKALLLSPF